MTEFEKESSTTPSFLDGLRILVIESNLDKAFLLRAILQDAGAEVIEANLASTGLFALKRELTDLIIIGLELEDENAFSLIRKIREDSCETIRRIPAIALQTFWDNKISSTTAKNAGFQEFFTLPIEVDERNKYIYCVYCYLAAYLPERIGSNVPISNQLQE
jgi:DNA-binding response OmpR family regulator